jgi:hypothetical protein
MLSVVVRPYLPLMQVAVAQLKARQAVTAFITSMVVMVLLLATRRHDVHVISARRHQCTTRMQFADSQLCYHSAAGSVGEEFAATVFSCESAELLMINVQICVQPPYLILAA